MNRTPPTLGHAVAEGLLVGTRHTVAAMLVGALGGGLYGVAEGMPGASLPQVSGAIIYGLIGVLLSTAALGSLYGLNAAIQVFRADKVAGTALLGTLTALGVWSGNALWGSELVDIIARHGFLAISLAAGLGLAGVAFVTFVLTFVALVAVASVRKT